MKLNSFYNKITQKLSRKTPQSNGESSQFVEDEETSSNQSPISNQYNQIKNIILNRRSVRKYTPYKPAHKTIYDIINTAYVAPRAGNITTAHTILVEDRQKIATIANLCYQQSWISQARCVLVVTCDMSDMYKLYPDIAYRFATQNTACYIQNILLLTHSAGLSSCWVESFQEEVLKDFLKVKSSQEIHAVIPIGYGKEIPKQPGGNSDLMMLLSYDTFGNKTREHK
ncbi:MAG: nitroreductase family protein [Candidatus Nanoarchaeia archaeon]